MQKESRLKGKEEKEMEGDAKEEKLPPGFRFHPTDEELITYYLINKISDANFTGRAITDVDLNKCEPWELPGKAKMGEKEWYFFSLRDRKYPTGVRTNRATSTGYWKTTGKDKEIFNSVTSELVGMKKTLVFYRGRAPRGEKTNWVMHEYRIHSKAAAFRTNKDEWVVCRVFQKSAGAKKYPSNQSRPINPSYIEMGPSHHLVPSPMNMLQPENFQFHQPIGRNYMSNAEMAELTRVLRGGSSTSIINPPIQTQLMNYPNGVGGGGGSFTISGLNLNLGTQPVFRPMLPPPPGPLSMPPPPPALGGVENGYGAEMINSANGGGHANKYVSMEHCMDLDNYWTPY